MHSTRGNASRPVRNAGLRRGMEPGSKATPVRIVWHLDTALAHDTNRTLRRYEALAITFALILGSCANSPSVFSVAPVNATERMMCSTYPVGTGGALSTAFAVRARQRGAVGGEVTVIITAAHVLDGMHSGPMALAGRTGSLRDDPEVAVMTLPPVQKGATFYTRHPIYDLAGFIVSTPESRRDQGPLRSFITFESLPRAHYPRAGETVAFPGYPDVVPGTAGAFPVLRTGAVASYPTNSMRGEHLFLINADVHPGDSGAPVFTNGRTGQPAVIGMIIRRLGKTPKNFSHCAVAVDATVIREMVELVISKRASAHPN